MSGATKPCPYRPDVPIRDKGGKARAALRVRSVAEMTAALDWSMQDSRELQSKRQSNWSGTMTVEEYRDMLRYGWPDGLADAEGLEGLTSDRDDRLQFVRDVGGAFPVVPAALAGAPDAMLSPRPMPADNVRALTLVIDMAFNCYVNSEDVLKYAQRVMKLVLWLQTEQVDVTVYGVISLNFGTSNYVYCTPIRDPGTAFQPERIAATVHPSWLRRAHFAMCEREYYEYGFKECVVCRAGYGHPKPVQVEQLQTALPEAQSIILLPKPGDGDPLNAVKDSINLKLRRS